MTDSYLMDVTQVRKIVPFIGVDQVLFGMSPEEVEKHWGPPDFLNNNALEERVEFRRGVVTTYKADVPILLVEIGFPRSCINLEVSGIKVFAPPKIDRLREFLVIDNDVYEDVGMLVFPHLGISCTGFLHEDDYDMAVTAFRAGRWDEELHDMNPFNWRSLSKKQGARK